jgi:hypothetical protein
MPLEFIGKTLALTSIGFGQVAIDLTVKAPEIWAVFAVETAGCGFLPDRRPVILYERHIFSHLTKGQFDDGDISSPTPGGYGPSGAPQYDRLARAMALNSDAALQSTSWGLGQIMGMNFALAGFANAENMVSAMCDSEDNQLLAFAAFLKSSKLDIALQTHDWTTFARGYNGPNFAQNHYDTNLQGEYQKYSTGSLPDITVRAAQLYLTIRGFHPGPVDGIAGSLTRDAVQQFQKTNALPVTGIDDATLAALTPPQQNGT